jgi:hypothetical protein
MPIYAGEAPSLDRRTLMDVPSDKGEVFGAAFDSAISTNPTNSLFRIGDLSEAESPSPIIDPAGNAVYGPEIPKITAEAAREQVAGAGLDLKIPNEGIRQGALDILMQRQREQLAHQQILARSPGGDLGTQVGAGLAASLLDPLNIATAFVPIVGEARYAQLLEGATSTLGRAGVRAGVGAAEGAVGAALVEPLPLLAAAQDQTDYGLSDSLANIAFGGILGGGLHTAGGAISDALRRRLAAGETPGVDTSLRDTAATPNLDTAPGTRGQFDFAKAFENDPEAALRQNLSRQIEADQVEIRRTAQQQAISEITPTLTGERVGNVADLRLESLGLTQRDMALDGSFRDLAREFQGPRVSRKQAERMARDSINADREQIRTRQAEINTRLEINRAGELDRADLAAIGRGQIPDRLKPQIEARTRQIMSGFEQKPLGAAVRTARESAELADYKVRDSALRTAVAQTVSGRDIDVQNIFDLEDSAKAGSAIDYIKQPQGRRIDPSGRSESARIDDQAPKVDDLDEAKQSLADDQSLVDDLLNQLPEEDRSAVLAAGKDESEAAQAQADKAEQYSKAYTAAALCDIRNGR